MDLVVESLKLQIVRTVNNKILCAKVNLLFWLLLILFLTDWLGDKNISASSVIIYSLLIFIVGLVVVHEGGNAKYKEAFIKN